MEYLTFNLNNKVDSFKIETEYIVNYLINSKGKHNYYAYRFVLLVIFYHLFILIINIVSPIF